MGLAAIGASDRSFGRNPFDTYFSGAHFLEDYAEGKVKEKLLSYSK